MATEDDAHDDPDGHLLRYAPVLTAGPAQVLRLFRCRDGSRCAVAFSTAEALHALLGAAQELSRSRPFVDSPSRWASNTWSSTHHSSHSQCPARPSGR